MSAWVRRLSPRAEKTIRLVLMCAVAGVFGIIAVAIESETLGWVAVAIMMAGILLGPVIAWMLRRGGGGA